MVDAVDDLDDDVAVAATVVCPLIQEESMFSYENACILENIRKQYEL